MISDELKSKVDKIRDTMWSGGVSNTTKLESLEVPLPLQQAFTAAVESIERQKARYREQLDCIDTLFASLQHRAFRGEL
jgi:type I restriction enzyme S subunit